MTDLTTRIRVLYNDALDNRNTGERSEHRASETDTDKMRAENLVWAFVRFEDCYQAGDPLLDVYGAEVPGYVDPYRAAEDCFQKLNIDHPEGWQFRSMCIGDVVIVGETALVCDRDGWTPVTVTAEQIK